MSPDPTSYAIEERAAAWLVERDGGLSAERERELARWLREDPQHQATFTALAETWHLIGEGALAAERREHGTFTRWRWRWPVGLAAAAALALVTADGWRGSLSTPRERAPFVLAATTDIGGHRQLHLPDGSTIGLNTDSAVDIRFEAGVRRVWLRRGEAHFTVARESRRPFIVSADGVDVRVVGTIFNVRLRPESVDVLVTEGKVRVGAAAGGRDEAAVTEPAAAPISELTAHQKVSIARVAAPVLPVAAPLPVPVAPVEVSMAEIRQALAWQTQRLDFDGAPLRDIVAEFNRYNRHKLIVADPRLEHQRFGGSFPAADHQTFVRMLEADFGIVAERTAAETRLRWKRR